MNALAFVLFWGSPVGLGLIFALTGIGAGVLFSKTKKRLKNGSRYTYARLNHGAECPGK